MENASFNDEEEELGGNEQHSSGRAAYVGPDGNSDPSPQQFTSELRPQKIPALLLSSGDCLFFSLRSLSAHAHTCMRMIVDMLSVCVYVCVHA